MIRKAAGIEFPGWDPTRSNLIAEVELTEEPPPGVRHDAAGVHGLHRMQDGKTLIAVYGTDFGIHNPTWISRFTDMTRQAAAYGRRDDPGEPPGHLPRRASPRRCRALRYTMAQTALQRHDERIEAVVDVVSEWRAWTSPANGSPGSSPGSTSATTSARDIRCSGAACPISI